jgi:hypothetical protein
MTNGKSRRLRKNQAGLGGNDGAAILGTIGIGWGQLTAGDRRVEKGSTTGRKTMMVRNDLPSVAAVFDALLSSILRRGRRRRRRRVVVVVLVVFVVLINLVGNAKPGRKKIRRPGGVDIHTDATSAEADRLGKAIIVDIVVAVVHHHLLCVYHHGAAVVMAEQQNNDNDKDNRKPLYRAVEFRGLCTATTCGGTTTMIGLAVVVIVFDSVVVDFMVWFWGRFDDSPSQHARKVFMMRQTAIG